jgi:hypothetical protein
MDRQEREIERKYHSGEISEGDYYLYRLNQDIRLGIRPALGAIMSTPAGVVYFNGQAWTIKSLPPPSRPPISASGVIGWTPLPLGGAGALMTVNASGSWDWVAPAYFDYHNEKWGGD